MLDRFFLRDYVGFRLVVECGRTAATKSRMAPTASHDFTILPARFMCRLKFWKLRLEGSNFKFEKIDIEN